MSTEFTEMVKSYRPIEALVPAHWQHSRYTTNDGAELSYYDTGGNKPALLLLHGFQAAGLMWLRTAKAFEAAYRVLMPDFRGHGYSHASLSDFSLARLTEDIADMIAELKLGKPSIVGHSLGAEITGRVAALRPDLVGSVVLVDPPMRVFQVPPSVGGEPPPWLKQWLATMQAINAQPHTERIQTALKLLPPGAPIWEEIDFVPYAEACAQLNLDVLQFASTMPYSVATPEITGQIQAPLLLLTGNPQRGSGATPEGIATLMEGASREHMAFDDAGHFIPIDQFERFVDRVRSFLEQS